MFAFLKDSRTSADREIFMRNDKMEDVLVLRPLKEKFLAEIKILAQETLPSYYDRWGELKASVQSLLCQDIEGYLIDHKPILSRVSVIDRTNFSNRKDEDFYDNLIVNLAVVVVYKQLKIYTKKYNFQGNDRIETISYFFKLVQDQVLSKRLKS